MFEKINDINITESIIVLPDFFIDRIIKLSSRFEFYKLIDDKIRFRGGSIRGIPTIDYKGGNAVNVSYCLAKLGINVALYTIADEIGSSILHKTFSEFGKKVDLHIKNGRQGLTTSLEFEVDKSNVMFSDLGDIPNYGPNNINSTFDLELLSKAKGIILTNWASNLKGTELAYHVFSNSPNAIHFIDPADIETRKNEFRNVLKDINKIIHVLSINENEFGSLLSAVNICSDFSTIYNRSQIKKNLKLLSTDLGLSIDLHTSKGSAWSDGNDVIFVDSFNVKSKISTGAGDSWDAADMFGYLIGLDKIERLLFSNAFAALFISNTNFEPPSIDNVLNFLYSHKPNID